MSGIYKEEYKFCAGCGGKIIKVSNDYTHKHYDRLTGIPYIDRIHYMRCSNAQDLTRYHDEFVLEIEKINVL